MRRVGHRIRPFLAIAAVFICCSSSGVVLRAQDDSSPESSVVGGPTRDDSAEEPQLILLQDGNGEVQTVPYSEAELRRLLQDRFSPPAIESPIAPVYISEFQLEGLVEEDRALLTATVSVEVTSDGAFDVPLHLNQAHVNAIDHEGPGRAAPIPDTQRDDGLHWRLEGRGKHRLELTFWVPLRTSPIGHQLLLTLPALPEYLVTRISLQVPGVQSVLQRPEIVDLEHRVNDGMTEISAEIEGQRLDLTWSEPRQSADTFSSVRTMMTLSRGDDQLLLEGKQEFTVGQANVSEVDLELPDGFEFEEVILVGARDQRTSLTPHPVPDDPRSRRVMLPEPLHQEFTLVWTLRRSFAEEGGVVTIDGPGVSNSGNSQGEITIETIDGYTIHWDEAISQGVERMTVRDEGAAWGGFKSDDPQFRLQLEFVPITAETDVDIAHFVRVDSDELLLTLDINVHVLSGSVRELQFLWPERNAEGWTIIERRIPVSAGDETHSADFDDEQAVLTLADPVGGVLQARLRFKREFPEERSDVDLTLPLISGTASARPMLFLAESIDVTAELTGESILRGPMGITSDRFETLPAGFEDARGWQLSGDQTPLHIQRTRHQRTVTATTSVTIGSPDGTFLKVEEEFAYQVAYDRIETMLFEIPQEVLQVAGLQFVDEDGSLLMATFDGNQCTVSLPPRQGTFPVRLEYALPLPATFPGRPEEYQLPIVQPVDADVSETTVHTSPTTTLEALALDAEWTSMLDPAGRRVWHADGNRDHCRLELRRAVREFAQRLDVEACYLRTEVFEDGSARTHGVYLLERPPGEVLISLPSGHLEFEFQWNGKPLAAEQETEDGPYLLTLPGAAESAQSGRLSVDFQVDAVAEPGVLMNCAVEFPSFGPEVHIDEMIWEVVLPHRQLLSRMSFGMTPEFTWQRKAVLWMRSPTPYVQRRRAEILGEENSGTPTLTQGGNRYAFSATGGVSHARIESMSQSLIVFIGAGIALLLGFVFGRFPAVRNVYSLLVLAFAFSLTAVWHLDLMQLLVQPAVVGGCLAILAVKFDTATRASAVLRKVEIPSSDIASDAGERVSSMPPGASSSPVARTALYPATDTSNSGSHPHD